MVHRKVAVVSPGISASKPAATAGCQPKNPPAIISRSISPLPNAAASTPRLNNSRTSPARAAPARTPARPVAKPNRQLPGGSPSGSGPQTGHGYNPWYGVKSPDHQGCALGMAPTYGPFENTGTFLLGQPAEPGSQ